MYKHTMGKGPATITIEVIEEATGFKVQSTLCVLTQVHKMVSETYEDLNKATIAAFEWVNFQIASL